MLQLIKLDIAAEKIVKLRSVRHYDGLPLDAQFLTESIVSQEHASQEQK
jgi:2-oxoglutarate ferredoxin oxidoreductase subunit alpha